MKKVWAFLMVLVLCLSFSSVALAKTQELNVTDSDSNPIDWIEFKLHPQDEYTDEVDTVLVNPLYYGADEIYAAAEAAYPGEAVFELGGITMGGYCVHYDYIFDYFGPFTATVSNPDVHNGDKVVLFILNEDEQPVHEVRAFCVKEGTFSFRSSAPAYCAYVILH